jgi:hypothetical protein
MTMLAVTVTGNMGTKAKEVITTNPVYNLCIPYRGKGITETIN